MKKKSDFTIIFPTSPHAYIFSFHSAECNIKASLLEFVMPTSYLLRYYE